MDKLSVDVNFFIDPPELWICPVCTWLIPNVLFENTRSDTLCPVCSYSRHKDFLPVMGRDEIVETG